MTVVRRSSIPCGSEEFSELSTGLLRSGVSIRFLAHGESMAPLVRDGDVLLVAPVEIGKLLVGDVVLCLSHPGRVVVHRVVALSDSVSGLQALIQGDNVRNPDGAFGADSILGRLVSLERSGARIDAHHRPMRLLGRFFVWRSRSALGQGRAGRLVVRALRRMPGFASYLT